MIEGLLGKVRHLFIISLLLLTSSVNAHVLISTFQESIEAGKERKLIFGTTNAPHTKLFKKANIILTHAFAKLGYQFSLVNLPNKRNLLWLSDEKIDGIAFRIERVGDLYPNLVRVEEVLFSIEHWVYSREKIEINGWQSISQYIVAYEQGSLFIEENKEYFQHLMPSTSTENAIALVYKKQAELAIASKSTGDEILEQNKLIYKGEIKRQGPALLETPMFSYFHHKHQVLAIELAQVLKNMKENGEYEQLLKQVQ